MSEITPILSTDKVSDSRAVINTNFSNLNTDKAEKADIQKGTHTYADDTGSANAYVVTLTPAPTVYTKGMKITFKVANANTGASTLNVNALGLKSIKKLVGQDLEGGEIPAGAIITVTYDGINFQLESVTYNVVLTTGDQTIAGVKTFSSIPVLPAVDPTLENQAVRKKYIDDTTQSKTELFTYGETIAVNDALYLKAADGRVYKTDADFNDERIHNFIGFAKEAGIAGEVKKVQIGGKVSGFSGLTVGIEYYLTNIAGAIGSTPGTNPLVIGLSLSSTELLIIKTFIGHYVVSETLRFSNDTEKGSLSTTAVKLKETKVDFVGKGRIRVKFDLRSDSTGIVVYGQIYKNGTAIGILRSTDSTTYTTYTEDFDFFAKGDLIQIYAYTTSASWQVFVRNFRFFYDRLITTTVGYIAQDPP